MTAATPMYRTKPRQSGANATLDIYGVSDEAQGSLETLVADLDTHGAIALRGYDPLCQAEEMATECTPITYNIKYGPADIITDGVDGFLVPDSDIDAMARRINDIRAMDEQRLMQMRQAAIQRVSDFSPEKITQLWGAALTRAVSNKQPPVEIGGYARLSSISIEDGKMSLRTVLSGDAASGPDWALLSWTERKGGRFGRLPARLEQVNAETQVVTSAHADDFAAVNHGHINFWIDLRANGHPCKLRVKGASDVKPQPLGHLEVCPTRFGSLSLRFPTLD